MGLSSSLLAAVSHERQVHQIASKLRCPVCANLSVADSPSEFATQMRELIKEKVAQGESQEQILGYFASRYGEWILLEPKKGGLNLLLWLLPFAGVVAAGAGTWLYFRKRPAPREEPPHKIDPRYVSRLKKDLQEFDG